MLFPVTKREKGRKRKKKKIPRWFTEKQNNPQTHSIGCLLRLKANSTTAPKNKGVQLPLALIWLEVGHGSLTLGILKLKHIFRKGDARGALPRSEKANAGYSRVPQTLATATSSSTCRALHVYPSGWVINGSLLSGFD